MEGPLTTTRIGGLHDVRIALETRPGDVLEVWIDERRNDHRMHDLEHLARHREVPVNRVPRAELDRLANGLRHQGVVGACRGRAPAGESGLDTLLANLDHDPLLLVLDGVQDPHNLGACLRTADAAGVDAVVVPADRSCPLNGTVSRVAAGAAHSVPVFAVSNLGRTLDRLKKRGVWLAAAAGDAAETCWERDLGGPLAVVLGGEGRGLRELTRRKCDFVVSIPMTGVVESLNVSVAAAILLYEARRRRRA